MSRTHPCRNCASHNDSPQVMAQLLKVYREQSARVADDGATITVPINFHICFLGYNTTQVQADCQYTITELNKDFSKQASNFDNGKNVYTDPSLSATYTSYVEKAASVNIVFTLGTIVYNAVGNQSSSNISVLDTTVKGGSPAINPLSSLNIWVADLSSGLLGYAQFPWELNSAPSKDGVLIAKGTWGQNPSYTDYNLNKTLTHEIGHWFGLYHTFQSTFAYQGGNIDYVDGNDPQETKGDCVIDTPPQLNPTYGNPFSTPTTWPTSKPSDESQSYRAMFMDFMDYVDDIAMFMFTADQASKMRQMVRIYRSQILTGPPAPSPPPIPTPTPTPIPYNYTNTFEGTIQQRAWKLINNISQSAQFSTANPYRGRFSLRTMTRGYSELTLDVTNKKSLVLSVWAFVGNSQTKVWVLPSGANRWLIASLPKKNSYTQYSFNLPTPYGTGYKIRLGTASGTDRTYSYFDNVTVSGTSTGKVGKMIELTL